MTYMCTDVSTMASEVSQPSQLCGLTSSDFHMQQRMCLHFFLSLFLVAANVRSKIVIQHVESVPLSENVPEIRNIQRRPNTPSSQTCGGPTLPTTTEGGSISNNNGNGHTVVLPD